MIADSKVPYSNIVASGENAAYLHYVPSNDILTKNGDLLLVDAGVRLYGYCSDITRTVPINGKYT